MNTQLFYLFSFGHVHVYVCLHEFLHIMCEQGPQGPEEEVSFPGTETAGGWGMLCECWNHGFCGSSKWTSLLITIPYPKNFFFCVCGLFFFNNVFQFWSNDFPIKEVDERVNEWMNEWMIFQIQRVGMMAENLLR